MPIDLPTLQSIRRMLRASVRHAEIAKRFDLAVGTISRIASVRRLRRAKLHLLTEDELPEDDPPPDYLAANLRRCPGCGGLVYQWPCLACRLRELKAPTSGRGDEPVDVPLCETADDGRVALRGTLTTGQGFDHDVGRGSPDPALMRPQVSRPAARPPVGSSARSETCAEHVIQRLWSERRLLPVVACDAQHSGTQYRVLNC